MTEPTHTDIMADLDALLEEEREALLTGALHRIEELMQRKSALIDTYVLASADKPDALADLQGRLGRNQVLFDQALAGIRNVAARLGTLRRLRKTLETYDRNGQKSALVTSEENRLERRA